MHHDGTATVPDLAFNLIRLAADQSTSLFVRVLGEASTEFCAIGPCNVDHIATPEIATHCDNANRQQAVAIMQGPDSARIDLE